MGSAVRRGLAVALCTAVVGLGWMASSASADGPEIGVNLYLNELRAVRPRRVLLTLR